MWLPPGFPARLPAVPIVPSSTDHAQLSSINSAIDDLTARITSIAERYQGTPREDLASDLFEVERNLRAAARRLATLVRATRP